ncbi:hypothetical protein HUJ05_009329 [Dendroctonus ponderosae]|nr:hypothetical protein HUJ05_009329 [Dendroctonus ponderosae]
MADHPLVDANDEEIVIGMISSIRRSRRANHSDTVKTLRMAVADVAKFFGNFTVGYLAIVVLSTVFLELGKMTGSFIKVDIMGSNSRENPKTPFGAVYGGFQNMPR